MVPVLSVKNAVCIVAIVSGFHSTCRLFSLMLTSLLQSPGPLWHVVYCNLIRSSSPCAGEVEDDDADEAEPASPDWPVEWTILKNLCWCLCVRSSISSLPNDKSMCVSTADS